MPDAALYAKAKQVFLTVCDAPDGERSAVLRRECGDDSGLRRLVVELLAHDEDPSGADFESVELPAPAAIGGHIGGYRILRLIGEGGMGVVYEAEQDNPRRTVALKLIRPEFATPSALRRFGHEAQVLGRLQHPGIAQIYEAGHESRTPFFAMEFIRGQPVLDFARTLDLPGKLDLAARIADAVQHAHQQGVIHRDLKPANILVDERGQPRVLDFGVARVLDETTPHTAQTSAGQLIGTVAYMSPEQAAGNPEAIDTRTDIYSLGLILYELLAARRPYDTSDTTLQESLRVIREVEPVKLGSVDPRLRGDIETIAAHALEKDRTRRYQTAAELAEDIRRYLRSEPIRARPQTAIYQLRKFARRHKAIVAGALVALAAMIIGTTVAVRQATNAIAARKVADEKSDVATRQALRATLAAAAMAVDRADPRTARRLLDSVPPDQRQWEWRHLSAGLDQSAAVIEADGPVRTAAFSPDGKRVVTITSTGVVQTWDPDLTTPLTTLTLDDKPAGAIAITRDGARIAAVIGPQSDGLALWDGHTGARIASASAPTKRLGSISMSPDGNRVAVGGPIAYLWLPSEGGELRKLAGADTTALAFSKDGRTLGTGYGGAGHFVDHDGATGVARRGGFSYTGLPVSAVDLGDDGRQIVVGLRDKRIYLHDLAARKQLHRFLEHTGPIRTVAIEPGEKRIASGGDDGIVRIWDAATGGTLAVLIGHSGPVDHVAFSPDGNSVLGTSGKFVRVWGLGQAGESEVLRGHSSYVYGVAFVADGRRLITGAWDKTLRVWDPRAREFISAMPVRENVYSLCAVPDSTKTSQSLLVGGHMGLFELHHGDTVALERDLRRNTSKGVTSIACDSGGRIIAARNVMDVQVYRAPDWSMVATWPCSASTDFSALSVSPDGTLVAADGPGHKVTIWNVSTGRPRQLDGHRSAVCAVTFSPDGSLLATGGGDADIRLWNVKTGQLIRSLPGHSSTVYDLAFSPDGLRLASGSNDTTIRLWDVATGDQVALLSGHNDYVFALAFSPDGSMIASASGDSTVRIWDTEPRHLRMRERALMRRLRLEQQSAVDEALVANPGNPAAHLHATLADDPNRLEASLQLLLQVAPPPGPTPPKK